jgi:hypothetical protein
MGAGETMVERQKRKEEGKEKRAEAREKISKEIDKMPLFVALREMNSETVPKLREKPIAEFVAKVKPKTGQSTAQIEKKKSAEEKN